MNIAVVTASVPTRVLPAAGIRRRGTVFLWRRCVLASMPDSPRFGTAGKGLFPSCRRSTPKPAVFEIPWPAAHAKGTNVKEHRHCLCFAAAGRAESLPALAVVELLRETRSAGCLVFLHAAPHRPGVLGKVQTTPALCPCCRSDPSLGPGKILCAMARIRGRLPTGIRARRPAVIVGAGDMPQGRPSTPALKMAFRAYLLNSDAVPGRANDTRRPTPRSGMCVSRSGDVTRHIFPPTARVHVTAACPLRKAFRAICEFAARLDAPQAVRDMAGE
jgi:hypothetical protein